MSKFITLCAIAVVAYVFFNSGDPSASQAPPLSPALQKEVEQSLATMSGVDFRQLLAQNNGKYTLLTLYTSWCPYCRTALPQLLELKKNQPKSLRMAFVSLDKKPEQLVQYLGQAGYHREFTPYLFSDDKVNHLKDITKQYQLNFTGGVPYVALLAPDGKLVADNVAAGGWDQLNKALKQLK